MPLCGCEWNAFYEIKNLTTITHEAVGDIILHLRTSAPPHLRTSAPPHLRTSAPLHLERGQQFFAHPMALG